jgi:hypothetical protein
VSGFDAKYATEEPSLQILCEMRQNSTNIGADAVLFFFLENKKPQRIFAILWGLNV